MMLPALYETERATVYHGRAEDVLPTLAKDSADLLVTDPPYGVAWQSNRGRNFAQMANDDGTLDLFAILTDCTRIIRCRRHLYVFGPYDLTDLEQVGAATELVWDKAHLGMGDLTLPWGPGHERIAFAALAKAPSRRAEGGGKLSARLRRGSVVRVLRPNAVGVHRHSTEKPVALVRQLVESSSMLGDVVLDPFCGSGSTGVAAILAGRRFVGIEIDTKFADMTAHRLADAEALAAKMDKL